MCPHCRKASELLGRPYMCRTCWRKHYKPKKNGKADQVKKQTTDTTGKQ